MANVTDYSFELINTFLINLDFKRANSVPNPVELPINTEIKVVEPGFPRLQVNVKIRTPEDTPVSFNLEVVGIFDYIGEKNAYDRELNKEFVAKKGLELIYVHAIQMVRIITGEMGMNPIQLKNPDFSAVFQNPPIVINNEAA